MPHRNNILYCNCEIKRLGKFFKESFPEKIVSFFNVLDKNIYTSCTAKYGIITA
jgi:hypothetical protein